MKNPRTIQRKRLSAGARKICVDLDFEGRTVEVSMPARDARTFVHDVRWCAIPSERSNGVVPKGCILAQDDQGELALFTRDEWRRLEVVEAQ